MGRGPREGGPEGGACVYLQLIHAVVQQTPGTLWSDYPPTKTQNNNERNTVQPPRPLPRGAHFELFTFPFGSASVILNNLHREPCSVDVKPFLLLPWPRGFPGCSCPPTTVLDGHDALGPSKVLTRAGQPIGVLDGVCGQLASSVTTHWFSFSFNFFLSVLFPVSLKHLPGRQLPTPIRVSEDARAYRNLIQSDGARPSLCPWPDGGPGPWQSGSRDFEVLSAIFSTCCWDSGLVSVESAFLGSLSAGQSSPGGSLLCCPASSLVRSSVDPRHVFTLCAVQLSSCLSSPFPSTFWAVSSTTFYPSL